MQLHLVGGWGQKTCRVFKASASVKVVQRCLGSVNMNLISVNYLPDKSVHGVLSQMVESGIVTNIQRCSTEDGPGIRTTVFLKGCPLSCIWCHNIETIKPEPQIVWYSTKCIGDQACVEACPEGVLELKPEGMQIAREKCVACGDCEAVCPADAIKIMGSTWKSNEIVEELLKDQVFFERSGGGVTLSGGEPTYQIDFCIEVARQLRDNGVHVALDTCGYCSEITMRRALEHVDMVLYDLKLMDPQKHLKYTGMPLDLVLSNANIVASSGLPIWVRTPVIPNHTADEMNIRAISQFILKSMPNVSRYELLAFNNLCIDKYALFDMDYPLKDYPLIQKETMENLASVARQEGVQNVFWSGATRSEMGETKNLNPPVREANCG